MNKSPISSAVNGRVVGCVAAVETCAGVWMGAEDDELSTNDRRTALALFESDPGFV